MRCHVTFPAKNIDVIDFLTNQILQDGGDYSITTWYCAIRENPLLLSLQSILRVYIGFGVKEFIFYTPEMIRATGGGGVGGVVREILGFYTNPTPGAPTQAVVTKNRMSCDHVVTCPPFCFVV